MDFQADVANVFFFYVRTMGLMTDAQTAWAITGAPTPKDVFVPEDSAADVGLAYEHIRSTQFAIVMNHLYEYAYHGKVDASFEAMETQGGIYTWVSAIVADALNGRVASEWNSHGSASTGAAQRCYAVAELANARVVLEGGEPFYVFSAGPKERC